MMLYGDIRCLFFRDANGSTKITFEEWYATMMYWLPLLDLVGNRPVSSVKNLLWRIIFMCNSFTESFPGDGSFISDNYSGATALFVPYPAHVIVF